MTSTLILFDDFLIAISKVEWLRRQESIKRQECLQYLTVLLLQILYQGSPVKLEIPLYPALHLLSPLSVAGSGSECAPYSTLRVFVHLVHDLANTLYKEHTPGKQILERYK